ncbi:lipocalin family protein [Lutimonas sp.]|uniref:lipocalin family protein n=1 Tax=Lutimonas sp. TaxID=1872403 RepID=UPI003D9B875E
MKKKKSLLIMLLVILFSVSCADDNEFHNLLGSWSDIPSAGRTPVQKTSSAKPPPIDGCTEKILITFNENLSGDVRLQEIECEDDPGKTDDFTWSIKEDELRISFEPLSDNDWGLNSGVNLFYISGDTLKITNEDGSSIEFLREQTAAM